MCLEVDGSRVAVSSVKAQIAGAFFVLFGEFFLSGLFLIVMAGKVFTVEEKKVLMDKANSDLKFLLEREGVDADMMSMIFECGIETIKHFAYMVKDTDELRQVVKDDFKVDIAEGGLAARVRLSKLSSAWSTAKVRASKLAEAEADSETRCEPKALPTTELAGMREAFERRWWKLEDTKVPGKTYLEKCLERVEKGDLKAEPLSEVLNLDEDNSDLLQTVFAKDGTLRAVKTSNSVPLPSGPEQLREKITLLGTAWLFMGTKHAQRPYFQDLSPQVFNEYLDYLLGEFCFKLVAKDFMGTEVSSPRWAQLLQYEHAIRVQAMKYIMAGNDFTKSLRMAWTDPVVKERYFTTPVAMQAMSSKRPRDDDAPSHIGDRKKQRQAKGEGKGKKGGKSAVDRGSCAAKTPEGKQICFAWNSASQKCSHGKACKFLHVCGKCFAKGHPAHECQETPK